MRNILKFIRGNDHSSHWKIPMANTELTAEIVRNALRKVMDPELAHNIVELGIIQNIEVDNGEVDIDMELTSPHCPFANDIMRMVKEAVMNLPGVTEVDISCPCSGDE